MSAGAYFPRGEVAWPWSWSLALIFRLPHRHSLCSSLLPRAYHMPCHLIFLYLSTLMKSGKEYRPWRFWVPNFSYPLPTFPLFGPNILGSHFRTSSVYVCLLMRDTKFYTHRRRGIFSAEFLKLRKVTISFAMFVRLHGTTRFPLDGFSWNFDIWGFFENLSRKFKRD